MSCLEKCCHVFHFGAFDCCECIELPIEADQNGGYILEAAWRNKLWQIESPLAVGELLKFQNIFNEDSTVSFKIIQPDGKLYKHIVYDDEGEPVAYYCEFSVTIREVYKVDQDLVTAQEICGSELAEDGSKKIVCKTF